MRLVRWIARLLSLSMLALVGALFVGEGGIDPFRLSSIERLELLLLFVACLGLALALRWDGVGGALVVFGILSLYAVELAVNGHVPRGWPFSLIGAVGLLFLLLMYWRRRLHSSS